MPRVSVVDPDPKLFAGSFGSKIANFGSGSDELQFLVTQNDIQSAETPLVTENFTARTKSFTVRLLKYLL